MSFPLPLFFFFACILLGLSPLGSCSDCSIFQQTNPIHPGDQWRVSGTSITRHSHTATAISASKVVLFGGISTSVGRSKVSDDRGVHIYDAISGTIAEDVPTINFKGSPQARFGHSAWSWRGSAYVFGGFVQDYSGEMWRFDYEGFDNAANMNSTWRQVNETSSSAIVPKPVYGHTANPIHSSDDRQVLMVFGGTTAGGTAVSDLSLVQLADTGGLGACDPTLIGAGESCGDFVGKRKDTEATWTNPNVLVSGPSAR